MYKLICVTSRKIFYDTFGKEADFAGRVREILDAGVKVILREKDMSEREYADLLRKIGRRDITAHTFASAAAEYGCREIHLPLPVLEKCDINAFDIVGSSVHSEEEAIRAQDLGASYITAGHVFATDCKKGLPPRGTEFITDVRHAVNIPVYAIGGISPENAYKAIAAGADGVCVMSGFMRCGNVCEYVDSYNNTK